MNENKDTFTFEELAEGTGISVRTIRYYLAEGLLGKGAQYGQRRLFGQEHLLRLQLIRLLKDRNHMPIDEIRLRLQGLSPAELRELLAEEDRQKTELQRAEQRSPREFIEKLLQQERAKRGLQNAPPPHDQRNASNVGMARPAPTAPAARQELPEETEPQIWQRLVLAPGVELHVRTDQLEVKRRLINRLCDVGRSEAASNDH